MALLNRLHLAHLIEKRAADRYQMHDLIRVYAIERASDEDSEADRDAALGRLYSFYLGTTGAAAQLLSPHIVRVPLPEPGEPAIYIGQSAISAAKPKP